MLTTIWVLVIVLVVQDQNRTDAEWLIKAESEIQTDLTSCIERFKKGDANLPEHCQLCKLTYNKAGNLIAWTNNALLPPRQAIDSITKLQQREKFLFSENRTYYQEWQENGDETEVILAPVFVPYTIDNDFLLPYVFLGRHGTKFTAKDLKAVEPYKHYKGDYIRLRSPDNTFLVPLKGLPFSPFRKGLRNMVVWLVAVGILLFLILINNKLQRIKQPELRDFILLGIAFLIRLVLFLFKLPTSYIKWGLFSPEVLGFNDILAPTLGDLTLNTLLYGACIWLIYKHGFRPISLAYRKFFVGTTRIWFYLIGFCTLILSLVYVHMFVFQEMIDNSQVDMEFSNLFATEYHAFVVLLDMGILLFSFFLIFSLLFRPFVIHILQTQRPAFWLISFALIIIVIGIFMFRSNPGLLAVSITSLFIWAISLLRFPDHKILNFDLVNYLLILFVGTTLTAYAILAASTEKNRREVALIAEKVIENRLEKATIGFDRTKRQLQSEDVQIAATRKFRELELTNNNDAALRLPDYAIWFGNSFLFKNFEAFERRFFAYDESWNRIDRNEGEEPALVPGFAQGDSILFREAIELQPGLYQTPNADAAFDTYLALFVVRPGSDAGVIYFLLELSPNPYGVGSVSPIVLVGNSTYTEDALFKRFDYAIYREGILTNASGKSVFKTQLPPESINLEPSFSNEGSYISFSQSASGALGGSVRTIVVRYPVRTLNQVFTTFSLVYYFFTLALALLLVAPNLGRRLFRRKDFIQTLPIRTKIRIAIVSVSFMPILGIILFLQPYIQDRFSEDASSEIITETQRVSKLIEEDLYESDDYGANPKHVGEILSRYRESIPFDITVFDGKGRQIGSTQPSLFAQGIYSGLLNEEAHTHFSNTESSHLVLEEDLGSFPFYAGYQVIWDKKGETKAYVQLAFLNKKEALSKQVVGLLAYLANIYLLAFLAVGVIAVLVSNALVKPLSIIQQRLSATRLGASNEPISSYKSKDEIGAIVEAYNNMVGKLGESEQALAATERQLAWRQMARQVAHEIKNPLTPMKLSIQHLMRNWKAESPNLQKMFPRVMKTLLTQIESMVNIADSFSQFAKMPEAKKDNILLQDVIHEVVDLYHDESLNIEWHIDLPEPSFEIFADKDQLCRSIGNIVKNGIQAMDDLDRPGNLHISFRVRDAVAQVEITDTGTGMTDEIQKRVFEPNFSTKNSGMGMGLAIVKRTIELNGGTVDFESESGIGTTFYVRIPNAGVELPEKRQEEDS
ncbi:MAG: ATP-binding protein [Bacteroidia bacterium]